MHLMHACEVIGYKHPDQNFREFFELVYRLIVYTLHLNTESCSEMDHRLTLDRVEAGTTERNF